MALWELDKSAHNRNQLRTHLPHAQTPMRVLIPVTCPTKMRLLAEDPAVSAAMDLPPFVSNPSSHSRMRWELFIQAQLYKEYYLLLYLLVSP